MIASGLNLPRIGGDFNATQNLSRNYTTLYNRSQGSLAKTRRKRLRRTKILPLRHSKHAKFYT